MEPAVTPFLERAGVNRAGEQIDAKDVKNYSLKNLSSQKVQIWAES